MSETTDKYLTEVSATISTKSSQRKMDYKGNLKMNQLLIKAATAIEDSMDLAKKEKMGVYSQLRGIYSDIAKAISDISR